MKIHTRLIVLVGLGMLVIMSITVLSLINISRQFSQTTRSMGQISMEVRRIWTIEQKIGDAVMMMHRYVDTADPRYRKHYDTFREEIGSMLDEMRTLTLLDRELKVLTAMIADFQTMEEKAARIFALTLASPEDRATAQRLTMDLDSLLVWMQHDIERYREENAGKLDDVAADLEGTTKRITVLFGIILFTMAVFLLVLGVYLYRKVSLPLAQLWEGTEEISRGNLAYRAQVRGENDIVMLAERFNEMARKLKESYDDLEARLMERTKQLAALNSVAFTLGQGGSLGELLQRSLETILRNFRDMEPRGGIFLCDHDGEILRLHATVGLPPEFVKQEQSIRMGECLCGIVAQTGEMIYSDRGCADPRHVRRSAGNAPTHIVVPLKSRGIVLGVLFLYPTKQFTLMPSDIQMFDTIGAELGMAVENLRLYGEVKESSIKYWDLFEFSRDILFTINLEGRLTSVNKAAERFIGRTKAELIGANALEFMTDDGKALAMRILRGEMPLTDRSYEFEVHRADGSRAYVDVIGRNLYQKQRQVGYHLAARDVTEQKALRELLVQAERLSAIGQIVVAVRHEVNNPLTTVIGNTELLLDRYGGNEADLKRRLQVVLDNALRIAEIVKRLQEIKQVRTVEYVKGVKMTDLGGD